MNAVTFACLKELYKVEESEYLDFFEVPQFFVYRLNEAAVTRLVSISSILLTLCTAYILYMV